VLAGLLPQGGHRAIQGAGGEADGDLAIVPDAGRDGIPGGPLGQQHDLDGDVAALSDQLLGPGGLYSRLADIGHAPVRFTGDVSTRMPAPEEAEFLRLTPPQPVFFLVRVAFDANDRPVETCEHIMSGDRWQLSYAWRPIDADVR
jgi:UTRA domain